MEPSADSPRVRLLVFLVVFIDLLGFGIVLPQLPLISDRLLAEVLPRPDAAALRGFMVGLLFTAFSLMQFLGAPVWGRLSDRVGRRPVILFGLAASAVFYALFGFGLELGYRGSAVAGLVLMYVSRFGAGLAGATIAIAQAVIADVTPPERRSRGMALIGAAFGLGFTVGPALGAALVLLAPDWPGAPGFTAALISAVALTLGVRSLPETRPAAGATGRHRVFDPAAVAEVLRTPAIGALVLAFFLATFAFVNFETTLAKLNAVLGLTPVLNLLTFTYVGVVLIIAQLAVYRPLAKRVPERTFLLIGTAAMAVGLAGLGFVAAGVSETTGFAASLTLTVVGYSFLNPSVQSLISRWSPADRQGEFLGVNQAAAALSRVIGPVVGVTLFDATSRHAAPYALAAVLMAVSLALVARLRPGAES